MKQNTVYVGIIKCSRPIGFIGSTKREVCDKMIKSNIIPMKLELLDLEKADSVYFIEGLRNYLESDADDYYLCSEWDEIQIQFEKHLIE